MLLVGSRADEAASPKAIARSCVVVVERLRASLAADAARLRRELEKLQKANGSALAAEDAQHRGHFETNTQHRAQQLERLLASPLRLSADAVTVSAKTLENVDVLRGRLLDTVFDKSAFPEFGTEQPWVYARVAEQLSWIAAVERPSLTWTELLEALQSGPPAGSDIEVRSLGTVLEGQPIPRPYDASELMMPIELQPSRSIAKIGMATVNLVWHCRGGHER